MMWEVKVAQDVPGVSIVHCKAASAAVKAAAVATAMITACLGASFQGCIIALYLNSLAVGA